MERKEQYKRKFEFVIEKISNLPQDLKENQYYLDALFYRLQISIDACMDIVAMLCKDLGITVKDDYSNLDELEKLNIYTKTLLEELRKWNGLRNAIVHKYNKIEEYLVLKEKEKVKSSILNFIEKTEEFINEKFSSTK